MRTIKVNEGNVKFVGGHNCMSLIGKKHFIEGEFVGWCMFGVTTSGFPMLRIFPDQEELNNEMERIINSPKQFEEVR
jgi:hypothetical protein